MHRVLARVTPTLEERARHLALAGEPPAEDVALVLDDAARSAAARGSASIAADLSELAARFTPPPRAEERHRRLCDGADFHLLVGDARRAYALAEPLIAEAPAGVSRARVLFVLSVSDPDIDKRLAAAEQALAKAAGADELAARIHQWFGLLLIVLGPIAHARAHAEQALALRKITDASRAQAMALVVLTDLVLGNPPDDELLTAGLEIELSSGVSTLSCHGRPRCTET